jgi:hypothetical protein
MVGCAGRVKRAHLRARCKETSSPSPSTPGHPTIRRPPAALIQERILVAVARSGGGSEALLEAAIAAIQCGTFVGIALAPRVAIFRRGAVLGQRHAAQHQNKDRHQDVTHRRFLSRLAPCGESTRRRGKEKFRRRQERLMDRRRERGRRSAVAGRKRRHGGAPPPTGRRAARLCLSPQLLHARLKFPRRWLTVVAVHDGPRKKAVADKAGFRCPRLLVVSGRPAWLGERHGQHAGQAQCDACS